MVHFNNRLKKIIALTLVISLTLLFLTGTFCVVSSNVFAESECCGEYIYTAGSESEARNIAQKYNAEFISYSKHGFATLNFSTPVKLNTDIFTPNYRYQTFGTIEPVSVNDKYFNQQYGVSMIDADDAWNFTTGSKDITIAVIDTGFDISHEDFPANISPLSSNITTGEVLKDNTDSDILEDIGGHGTAISGIIGSPINNNLGIAGISPDVSLMLLKIADSNGELLMDKYIEAIYYAVDNGADIINISLGRDYTEGESAIEKTAIDYACEKGVILVCASGNECAIHPCYPAFYDNTICVSAVGEDTIFEYNYSNHGKETSICAPGTNIATILRNNRYAKITGTSAAAAFVSSTLALIKAKGDYTSSDEIVKHMEETAFDISDTLRQPYYGYGIVNAFNAVADETCKVTIDVGDDPTLSYTVACGNTILRPLIIPRYEGFEFQDWYIDDQLTEPWVFRYSTDITNEPFTVDEDTYIYASWTSLPPVTSSPAPDSDSDIISEADTDTETVSEADIESEIDTETPEDKHTGDVNSDGKTDIIDVVLIRAHIININKLEYPKTIYADVNNDERIDITDVVIIRFRIINFRIEEQN